MNQERGSALWEALVAASLLSVAISSIVPMSTALQRHQRHGMQQRDAHQQALSLAAELSSGRSFPSVHIVESAWWTRGVDCFTGVAPVQLRDIRWRDDKAPMGCGRPALETRVLALDA